MDLAPGKRIRATLTYKDKDQNPTAISRTDREPSVELSDPSLGEVVSVVAEDNDRRVVAVIRRTGAVGNHQATVVVDADYDQGEIREIRTPIDINNLPGEAESGVVDVAVEDDV